MKRLLAFGLVIALGNVSAAFAEESLLTSANRLARQGNQAASIAQTSPTSVEKSLGVVSFAEAARVGIAPARTPGVLAQQGGTISQTGMSKRTKSLIIVAAAAAFFGTAYGIDHKVKDVTPSSLGTREDNSVFNK